MARTYQQAGLVLGRGHADKALVKALQRDLRALGYLRRGIDGDFGAGTEAAVRALQFDLMNNDGTGPDGKAPVALRDFNKGRVAALTGSVDATLAACIDELMTADTVQKLPRAPDADANKRALAQVLDAMSKEAPTPFLVAMVRQESDGRHFAEPSARDEDDFVTVGLDRNKGPDQITSRGYGIGQHTLFHHPPSKDEVDKHIADPVGNVAKAYKELRHKFDRFLLGPDDTADDRKAEHAQAALRLCKHEATSVQYLRDCANCAKAVAKKKITSGDAVFTGATLQYAPSAYYASADYDGVPGRAEFACDWPYAVRRYNGGGINSYHYQARVLLNLLK